MFGCHEKFMHYYSLLSIYLNLFCVEVYVWQLAIRGGDRINEMEGRIEEKRRGS